MFLDCYEGAVADYRSKHCIVSMDAFQVLNVTVRVIQRDADEKKTTFHPRPYFRLFVTWLMDFNSADPALESSNYQVTYDLES